MATKTAKENKKSGLIYRVSRKTGKAIRLLMKRMGAFFDGIDQVVYTPLRLISVFSQLTFNQLLAMGRGIAAPIAFAIGGLFGFLYAAYDTWRELRDKDYHRYRTLGKILLTDTVDKKDYPLPIERLNWFSRSKLNRAIKYYLEQHKEALESLNKELFGAHYTLDFSQPHLVLQASQPAEKKTLALAERLSSWAVAIWNRVWTVLALYSMIYWLVYMSAMLANSLLVLGAVSLAFSPFIAFAVPALLVIACLAPRFLTDIYRYFYPNNEQEEMKAARMQLLKAFWLRNKHAQAAKQELEKAKDQPVENLGLVAKPLAEQKPADMLAAEQQPLQEQLISIGAILKGKKRDAWLYSALGFIKTYVVSIFVLWPLTDMLSFFGIAIPGVSVIAFVLPFIFAAVYAGYAYQQGKQDYAERKAKLADCEQTINAIDHLRKEARGLKREIKAAKHALKALLKQQPSTEAIENAHSDLPKMPAMPQHGEDDVLKQMDPNYKAWNRLDKIVDTSRNIIGPAGTGAFIVRSILLMPPLTLIFPVTSVPFLIAAGAVCAVIAAVWIGISLWEYRHNKERNLASTYLQEINLRKGVLQQEIEVLNVYKEVLERKLPGSNKPMTDPNYKPLFVEIEGVQIPLPAEQLDEEVSQVSALSLEGESGNSAQNPKQ